MVATVNNPRQAKKGYTLSLSEEEIERELSLIFDPQMNQSSLIFQHIR
jgi:hypothetical protein